MPTRRPRWSSSAGPKIRATFHLPADLFEQARDAVVFLSGPPVRLTLAGLAATALARELARLKRRYNGGDDFPVRRRAPRPGRRSRAEPTPRARPAPARRRARATPP